MGSRHLIGQFGTRTSHLRSVSATLCCPDHPVRLVSGKGEEKSLKPQGNFFSSSAVLMSMAYNPLHIFPPIRWSIFLPLSLIDLMILISSVFLECVTSNVLHLLFLYRMTSISYDLLFSNTGLDFFFYILFFSNLVIPTPYLPFPPSADFHKYSFVFSVFSNQIPPVFSFFFYPIDLIVLFSFPHICGNR